MEYFTTYCMMELNFVAPVIKVFIRTDDSLHRGWRGEKLAVLKIDKRG